MSESDNLKDIPIRIPEINNINAGFNKASI
jgi:hypothetical protein